MRLGSCYCNERVLVNTGHSRSLIVPVLAVILDNAERIDPHVLHAQPTADFNGVLKSSREIAQSYAVLAMLCDIVFDGPYYVLARTPTVRQSIITIRLNVLHQHDRRLEDLEKAKSF
jgi:hypothetical protein